MRGMSTISVGQSGDDIKGMLMHLEDEYRKAIISEKNYAELKEKYSKLLENFDKEKKMPKENDDIRMKRDEEKDVKMFIENLDEQYKKGEINKSDYENIKNVNMQRLKEIDESLGDEDKKYEIEIEIKKKEKESAFNKLFGRMKKRKKEEGKLEVEVSEDLPAPEEHVEERAPEEPQKEEVEIDTKKGLFHGMFNKLKGEKKIQVDVNDTPAEAEHHEEETVDEENEMPPEEEEQEVMTENTDNYNELVNDMFNKEKNTVENIGELENITPPKETIDNKEAENENIEELKEPAEKAFEIENQINEEDKVPLEEERPKKKGFFNSLFGKKEKSKVREQAVNEEKMQTENQETQNIEEPVEDRKMEETEEEQKVEAKPEEKEEPKVEEVKTEEKVEESKPEEKQSEPMKEQSEVKEGSKKQEGMEESPKEEKPKKSGFLKSIFKKKEEPSRGVEKKDPKKEPEQPKEEPKEEKKEENLEPGEIEEVTPEVIEKLASQMAESSGASMESVETPSEEETEEESAIPSDNKLTIEIEKLKVMIDTMRDSRKSTDETIQNISENIGEIRSMVMQSDANFKTTMANMERLEDEVSDIKPKEISKKFNEINESMERDRLEVEKFQKKSDGTNQKVNEIYEMIKSIGGVENLINVNNDIQTKLKDINEAIKYIQRIGAKTEKIFIDLSKGMEDLVMLKAKQEDFDDSLKNVLTSVDSLNLKLKEYVSKSDLEDFRGEIIMVKKQMDEIKKVLPVAELKLPENMIKLRKDKEDIEMFLDSLETQRVEGKINKAEYEEMKKINVKKLNDVESKLAKEWKDIDRVMKPEEEGEETLEDTQGGVVKRKKTRRNSKVSKKRSRSERERKKKILKNLKDLKE